MKSEFRAQKESNRVRNLSRHRKLFLEQLEFRAVLASFVGPMPLGDVFDVGEQGNTAVESAPQLSASRSINVVKETARIAAGLDLARIDETVVKAFAGDTSVSVPKFEKWVGATTSASIERYGEVDADGALHVQIDYRIGGKDVLAELRALDIQIDSFAPADNYGVARARVTAADLKELSANDGIIAVRIPPTATYDVITTAGDAVHKADQVRSRFLSLGVNGSGVKVGVLSNGVAHLSTAQAAGELPFVDTNPSLPGNPFDDEGTAMLEIIHDMAPGAELFFSQVYDATSYSNALTWMQGKGVKVVVDDLAALYSEPFFKDGPMAVAATNAIATGIQVVSSAGNNAQRHYQGASSIAALAHNFNPGGYDEYLTFTVPGRDPLAASLPFRVSLQWSDDWTGSSNNYNLYLHNSVFTQVASSTIVQNGTNQPLETIPWQNTSTSPATFHVRITGPVGVSRDLEVLISTGAINDTYAAAYSGDAVLGHKAADGVIATGAVAAGTPTTVQSYSARGPSTVYNNFATQTKVQRQSLDVVGTDAVSTYSGSQNWAPFVNSPIFTGTSAAAPHVAAVVALMMDAAGTNSTLNLATTLAASAVDISTGGYDQNSGSGRADSLEAVFRAYTPTTPLLATASDDGISNVDNVTSQTSLTINVVAPDGSFVGIFDNGSAFPIASMQLSAGVTNHSFTNISVGPNSIHNYTVKVKNTLSSTTWSQASLPLTIYVDSLTTQTPVTPDIFFGDDTGTSDSDNFTTRLNPFWIGNVAPSAAGSLVTLLVDGAVKGSVQLATNSTAYFFSPVLTYGAHTAVLRTQMLPTVPSTSYFDSTPLPFFIDDGQAPVATVTPVSPDPRKSAIDSFTVTFDRPVANFDIADLNLTKNAGANRFPGTATISTANSRVFTIAHVTDITMAIGNYDLTLNYSGSGIVSAAANVAPTASNPSEQWNQFNTTYQSPTRYLDVDNNGYISANDALQIINMLNLYGPGALPGSYTYTTNVDTDGNGILSTFDALLVINYLNLYPAPSYPPA